MAQKVEVTITDDINGDEDATTVSFGYRGKTYEIDLGEKNLDRLDEALAEFIEHARPVKANGAKVTRVRAGGNREQDQAIRDWARSQGLTVSDRGRIPADTQAAYEEAHAA